jgi:N-acetylglucosaminyl-diphospho-decaprenol L-rhamnosyltransferase
LPVPEAAIDTIVASVIVPSHDGRRWLARCLPRVGSGILTPHEIIVSDNGSRDDTAAWLAAEWPAVRAVCTPEAIGFAAACNRGARAASGSVLVFLNNDTEPQDGWLDRLIAPVVAEPDRVVATARLVLLDTPDIIDSAGDEYAWWGAAYKRGAGDKACNYDVPCEVFSPCGAAFAIGRDLFERLGGFDEVFGSVCEDVDLGYRVRLVGGRCVYEPTAVVRHAGSATLGIEAPGPIRLGQRNLEWTWWANTPAVLLVPMLPLHVIYNAIAALFFWRRGRSAAFWQGKREALAGWRHGVAKRRLVQAMRSAGAARIGAAMMPPPLLSKWREKRHIAARGPA